MSALRDTLQFLDSIGLYDVILPFLLVFTLVFAILERTKLLGEEKDGTPKKNLNAMVAFVSAFFVVASTKLVAIINTVIGHAMMLMLLSFLFLLLIASYKKEDIWLEKGWATFFIIIMFIGIVIIFLNALGWLTILWELIRTNYSSAIASSVILLALLIGLILFITHEPKPREEQEKKK